MTSLECEIQPSPRHETEDEGFAEVEPESLIIPKGELQVDSEVLKPRTRARHIYRQPKLKLTFMGREKNPRDELRHSIMQKEVRATHGRSLDIQKKESKRSLQLQLLADCVSHIKRTIVAQNISMPSFSLSDSKTLKAHLLATGSPVVYEQVREVNTHGFIRAIAQHNSAFVENEANLLLKTKLRDSFIMPRKPIRMANGRTVEFQGDFESGNLEFVTETAVDQFDLFLKNDTNTHGHQSWFLFRVSNSQAVAKTISLSICNIKRYLPCFSEGGRVYARKIAPQPTEWQLTGNNYQFKVNNNAKFTNSRVYRLSFDLTLDAETTLQVGLLPAYTYSDLLQDLKLLESCPHATSAILTYSLMGLAVPVVTFTRGESAHKQVILVSARIHPGETNASFMCRGLLRWLSQDSAAARQFLQRHVVKVVPMTNPDGVLLGNFRTNFLGSDLNRCFDSEDEVTNPEVVALKELGLSLKEEFGNRFALFLDLHGHSSERNIFSYGPDYQTTESNFYQIRLLPKILSQRSKMFKYHSCTFKLEDYKRYTARGFFLNATAASAYTLEASYGHYQHEGKLLPLGPHQWTEFGQHLAESLLLLSKINKLSGVRTKLEIKKALAEADKDQVQMIRRFKKEFKAEKEAPSPRQSRHKDRGGEDSDGEGDSEDFTRAQKEEVLRRVAETVAPNLILPRVLKPAILYPTVTPKLFKYRQQVQESQLKVLYTRRGCKFGGLRMPGNSFIQSLKGLDLMRPQAKHLLA